jgi:hypothetical protein
VFLSQVDLRCPRGKISSALNFVSKIKERVTKIHQMMQTEYGDATMGQAQVPSCFVILK